MSPFEPGCLNLSIFLNSSIVTSSREKRPVLSGYTAMDNENLFLHQVTDWHSIENFRKELERQLAVFGLDFTLEPVCAVHIVSLVVSARQEHPFRI
jgi:hypothetical protein